MTDEPRGGIGDNLGPIFDQEVWDDLAKRVAQFNEAAGQFWELGEIKTADQAAKCNDLISGGRRLRERIDDARTEQKKPWRKRSEEVDRHFGKLTARMNAIIDIPSKMQREWLRAEERRKREEREAERERVRREQAAAAQEIANATARFDPASKADADEKLKDLAKQQKQVARAPVRAVAESATGGARRQTIRRQKVGVIKSYMKTLAHYKGDPLIREALQKCVDRDVRARDVDENEIPGVVIEMGKESLT